MRSVGRSSVAEHRFGSSDPFTLGIEEEYMLLDRESLDLVQRADTILDADLDGELAARTACEIFQSEIEGQTPICATVQDVAAELRLLRAHLADVVEGHGLVLASAGTHPFARYEDQVVTDRDRYRGIVEQLQYPARRELIFGLHVHVGVDDPETAIQVTRLLRPKIAQLIALSASSPFWRGFSTGLHSTRHSIFATFPRSGSRRRSRLTASSRATWRPWNVPASWTTTRGSGDLRPHPRLGTVEVRAMDAVHRGEDAVALAGYVQGLVRRAAAAPPPRPPSALEDALVRENKWQRSARARRDGDRRQRRADSHPGRHPPTLDELAECVQRARERGRAARHRADRPHGAQVLSGSSPHSRTRQTSVPSPRRSLPHPWRDGAATDRRAQRPAFP